MLKCTCTLKIRTDTVLLPTFGFCIENCLQVTIYCDMTKDTMHQGGDTPIDAVVTAATGIKKSGPSFAA